MIRKFAPYHYIETSPQSTFLAPAIRRVFPDAKFLHIIRHPADIIRSGMRRGWFGGQSNDCTRIFPNKGEYKDRWASMNQFEKNVWLWSETNRWIVDFMDSDTAGSGHCIKAEDIFSAEQHALEVFYNTIGVDVPKPSSIKKVLGLQLNAQKKGEFSELSMWSDQQKSFLKELAGDLLERFSYDVK